MDAESAYADYVQYWNSYERVDIDSIKRITQDATEARLNVVLGYVRSSGSNSYTIQIDLVWNSHTQQWMIDATELLE